MIHNADGHKLFVESWDLTGERETGDALTAIVEEAEIIVQSKYNTKLYAVISDNASPMIKMGKQVNLWHATCNSHSANLLAKDLVKPELAANVNCVLKEFKHSDLEHKILKKKGQEFY